MGQSKAHQWIHVLLAVLQATLRTLRDAPDPVRDGVGQARRGGCGRRGCHGRAVGGAAADVQSARGSGTGACLPPFGADGTERRIRRPQDPLEQRCCYSGKEKCHTVKNVLLINAVLTILFLSETYAGSARDKRIAEATPYPPCPQGAGCSRIWASWHSPSTRSR
jgi:hypothetical protein